MGDLVSRLDAAIRAWGDMPMSLGELLREVRKRLALGVSSEGDAAKRLSEIAERVRTLSPPSLGPQESLIAPRDRLVLFDVYNRVDVPWLLGEIERLTRERPEAVIDGLLSVVQTSDENLRAVTVENERMRLAIEKAAGMFDWYTELHYRKPDLEKAKRNEEAAADLRAALTPATAQDITDKILSAEAAGPIEAPMSADEMAGRLRSSTTHTGEERREGILSDKRYRVRRVDMLAARMFSLWDCIRDRPIRQPIGERRTHDRRASPTEKDEG